MMEHGLIHRNMTRGIRLQIRIYNKQLNKYSLLFGNIFAELTIADGFTAGIRLHKERETNDYGQYLNSETERGRNDQGYAQRTELDP